MSDRQEGGGLSNHLRIDGGISIPTILGVAGMCLTLWGAVATNAAETRAVRGNVGALASRVYGLPERMASIEAYQKSQKEALDRIEMKLDQMSRAHPSGH